MTEVLNILIFPLILIIFLQNNLIFKYCSTSYKKINYKLESIILNFFVILNLILFISFFDLKIQITSIFLLSYFILCNFLYFNIKKNIFIINNFLFLLIIFYVLAIYIIANPDLSWDGKFHWYKRSLNFYQNMGFQNLLSLPKYEYPHFGSYLWALFWSISPVKFEYLGRIFYLFMYLLSIFTMVDLIKNKLIKKLLFVFLSLICFNFNHFTGNQDILVFSLIIFLTRYLYLIYEEKNNSYINSLLFVLINNIILWIKYECIIFVILSYTLIIFSKMFRSNYKLVVFFGISLIFTILLKLGISEIYKINLNASFQFSGDYKIKELFNIQLFFYKFYFLIKYFIFSMFKNPVLILGFISLAIIYFRKIKLSFLIITFFVLLNLSTFFIFYIIQLDFEWHVINGIDRYMLQYSGVSILFIIIVLNKYYKN